MSSLRSVYLEIALEVQARLSEEYLSEKELEIADKLLDKPVNIRAKYQPKAS